MEWDLGIYGLLVLGVMSLAFGAIAALVTWTTASHWIGVAGAATYFVSGLFISEVLYGWATEEELQPNIDGLSFDEVLLFGLIPSVIVVAGMWLITRHGHAGSASG
jgi:hypothetical protein